MADGWIQSYPYGWEPDDDGLRGHVFVSTDNSTVVISIKGTSASGVGGGPTVGKDKLNDNLLFRFVMSSLLVTTSSRLCL